MILSSNGDKLSLKVWNNKAVIDMRNQQPSKYSIKTTLKQHLASKNQIASLPQQTPSIIPETFLSSDSNLGEDRHIIVPQYHNYFLHTIEKEIKHEGNLLRRIRKKIDDFKEKQVEKKKIKNSRQHYSHLMFAPTPGRYSRSGTKNNTAFNTTTSTLNAEMHRTFVCSTPTTPRQTNKSKADSLTRQSVDVTRVKTANKFRDSSSLQGCKTFMPSRTSFYTENQLIEKFGRLVKHTKKVKNFDENGFSVMGGRPQWSTFQSYRNNAKIGKKML